MAKKDAPKKAAKEEAVDAGPEKSAERKEFERRMGLTVD